MKEMLDPTWEWEGEILHCKGPPTESMKLRAVQLDGTVLQYFDLPSESVIIQAIKTSPSIVFDDAYKHVVTTTVLNGIQAGLAATVQAIKELTPELTSRTELLRNAIHPGSEEVELPTNLDSTLSC